MTEISQLVSSDLDATGASTKTTGSEPTTKTEPKSLSAIDAEGSKDLPAGKLTHFFGCVILLARCPTSLLWPVSYHTDHTRKTIQSTAR